jgi:hypothetical protein
MDGFGILHPCPHARHIMGSIHRWRTPWKQCRQFLSFEFSLSNKSLAISIEWVRYPQTFPPFPPVDGVLDQKPSKSPCKRNPSVIHLQLNSAQKKRTPTSLSLSRRSVLHKAMLINSDSKRFGIANNIATPR